MLNKELAYKIFKTAWVLFLLVNMADYKPGLGMDLIPFIHVSELPYWKYIALLLFAVLIVPYKEYLFILRDRTNLTVLVLLVLLLITAYVSSLMSTYPDTAFRVTGRISFYVLVLFILIIASNYFKDAGAFIIKSYIYLSVVVIAGSLLDFFVPSFHEILVSNFDRPGILHSYMKINGEIIMRPMGFVTDANLAAFAIAFGLMLLLLNSSSFNKFFRYSYYIFGSFAFGMLTSRIALVMCVITVLAFLTLKAVERKELILFAILFLIFQAVTPQTYSRVMSFFDKEKIDEELTVGRPVIWSAAFRLYNENPVIGAGPGVFFEYSKDYMTDMLGSSVQLNITDPSKRDYHKVDKVNPHNIFLVMLSETGIIGFSLFLLLLINLFYGYITQKKIISALFLANFILISAFSNFAPYYKLYLVIAIVMFIASGKDMRLIYYKSLNVRQHEKNTDI